MEKHWLRREGRGGLAVFVLGWAAGHAVVEHITPENCDVLCIYDYRDPAPLTSEETELIRAYSARYLFAWSFGVLVAEYLVSGMEFTRAVAFNGTPHPLDDRLGIGRRRFALTLRSLPDGGMEAFDRRAYAGSYESLKGRLSPRGLAANIEELTALEELAGRGVLPSVRWDKAVVGEQDAIFPPQNMLDYWRDRAELLPLPHYPFADADIILREIDDR